MKKLTPIVLMLSFFLTAISVGFAQHTLTKAEKKQLKVQRHTVMERFEPEMVLSAEDRLQLKEDRIIHLIATKELLDTLNISKRKRRRLMRDLKRSPIFSERLNKVIAETKFEEDDN